MNVILAFLLTINVVFYGDSNWLGLSNAHEGEGECMSPLKACEAYAMHKTPGSCG